MPLTTTGVFQEWGPLLVVGQPFDRHLTALGQHQAIVLSGGIPVRKDPLGDILGFLPKEVVRNIASFEYCYNNLILSMNNEGLINCPTMLINRPATEKEFMNHILQYTDRQVVFCNGNSAHVYNPSASEPIILQVSHGTIRACQRAYIRPDSNYSESFHSEWFQSGVGRRLEYLKVMCILMDYFKHNGVMRSQFVPDRANLNRTKYEIMMIILKDYSKEFLPKPIYWKVDKRQVNTAEKIIREVVLVKLPTLKLSPYINTYCKEFWKDKTWKTPLVDYKDIPKGTVTPMHTYLMKTNSCTYEEADREMRWIKVNNVDFPYPFRESQWEFKWTIDLYDQETGTKLDESKVNEIMKARYPYLFGTYEKYLFREHHRLLDQFRKSAKNAIKMDYLDYSQKTFVSAAVAYDMTVEDILNRKYSMRARYSGTTDVRLKGRTTDVRKKTLYERVSRVLGNDEKKAFVNKVTEQLCFFDDDPETFPGLDDLTQEYTIRAVYQLMIEMGMQTHCAMTSLENMLYQLSSLGNNLKVRNLVPDGNMMKSDRKFLSENMRSYVSIYVDPDAESYFSPYWSDSESEGKEEEMPSTVHEMLARLRERLNDIQLPSDDSDFSEESDSSDGNDSSDEGSS